MEARAADDDRFLRYGALLYGAGLVLHLADHFRRGTSVLTGEVNLLGTISTVAGVITIGLVMARHRWAPIAAVALGFPVAVGVAAVHLLPRWSDFSDAFPGSTTGVNAGSWAVVLIEIVGAFVLGLAGYRAIRRSHQPAPAS